MNIFKKRKKEVYFTERIFTDPFDMEELKKAYQARSEDIDETIGIRIETWIKLLERIEKLERFAFPNGGWNE